MTIFSLQVRSATLQSSMAVDGFPTLDRWFLTLRCVLDGETLMMSDGVKECNIGFVMNFKTESSVHTTWLREKEGFEKAIGAAHYFPPDRGDEAKVFFEAHAPPAEMETLLAFARAGRFPAHVSVAVESKALTYGWAPDGSEKKWDAETKLVPVTDVSFSLPISQEEPEPDRLVEPESPRTPVGLDLVPELRKIADRQGWLLIALIGFAAIMLFKH